MIQIINHKNLSSKILSYLLFYLEANNINHYFLFTKPEYKKVFSNLNFNEIIETNDVVLYENNDQDITKKSKSLKNENTPKEKILEGQL